MIAGTEGAGVSEDATAPESEESAERDPEHGPVTGSPWRDLPPPTRPAAQRVLMNWVKDVFRPDYPEPAEAVMDCWPYHADAVATLRGLKERLEAVYRPPVKGGEIGAAPLHRMPDWDTDLEHAHDRWVLSFKRCDGTGEGCFRSKPASYSDQADTQAVGTTDLAAMRAWGAAPPALPPPMEPWELARELAAKQASASEEEGGEPSSSPDPLGPAEIW